MKKNYVPNTVFSLSLILIRIFGSKYSQTEFFCGVFHQIFHFIKIVMH